MSNTTTQKGFAFLYIVLITALIGVAITLSFGEMSISGAQYTRTHDQGAQVRALLMYCGEDLLMDVRDDPAVSSSGTLVVGDGECVFSISGSDPNKTITISATIGDFSRHMEITTTQTTPTIIAVWKETAP